MCRLYLIRHGETDWNKEKRYQGSQDIPLNEMGREQAKKIAQELENHRFNALYCSTLKRVLETAHIINQKHHLPIQAIPNLREASYGELEKKKIEDAHREYAESFATFLQLSSKEKLHHKTVPSQESGHEVLARVLPVLESIGQKHKNENVLVVTHGAVIRFLLISLAGYDWEQSKVGNAELVLFTYEKGKLLHLPS